MNGVVVADSALHAGKTTHEELASVLAACSSWPGAHRARQVIAFSDHGDEEFVGRVDFCWLEYLTIAEADGMLKYADPRRAAAQLERDQLLREVGYKVVHFTWRQLFRETERLIARIRDAFARPSPI